MGTSWRGGSFNPTVSQFFLRNQWPGGHSLQGVIHSSDTGANCPVAPPVGGTGGTILADQCMWLDTAHSTCIKFGYILCLFMYAIAMLRCPQLLINLWELNMHTPLRAPLQAFYLWTCRLPSAVIKQKAATKWHAVLVMHVKSTAGGISTSHACMHAAS